MNEIRTINHKADLCIIGGGLSGTIAAIAAARGGTKVVLVQDRPVLGGNSSSEIRMWVRGAKGIYNRETGILSEFEEENIYRNPTLAPTLWDSVLYGKVKAEENITLLLNCTCAYADSTDTHIHSITAWQLTTYTWHKVEATYFADCSGDGILSFLTPAKSRIGRESRAETGEPIAHETADSKTMGMSCLLQARETDHPVEFIPPEWANVYPTDDDFALIPYNTEHHACYRDHKIGTSGCNLWWIELGGDRDSIRDTEDVRDELLKVAFGIWDHLKNREDHGMQNWELEWVGFLPGKRESVRYEGEYMLTQHDVEAGGVFDDVIAYGGWPMDDHNPKGMNANKPNDAASILYPAPSPYGIPYRTLYSVNIDNLFFAGRDISATHAAMSSTRVMATCSLLGQAMGTAAAICKRNGLAPRELRGDYVHELQQILMTDGVFLPGCRRDIAPLSLKAKLNLTDGERELLFNGIDRPRSEEEKNGITLKVGDKIEFNFDEECEIHGLRVMFDPDFSRMSISKNKKMRVFAQKLHEGLDFEPVKVANTIVKAFRILIDGKCVYETDNNYHALVKVPLSAKGTSVVLELLETWGSETIPVYACEVM